MKQLAVCALLVVIAVSTVSCVAAIPLKQKKCYGLEVCKKTPSECQSDEKGLYQKISRASCRIDGGHT